MKATRKLNELDVNYKTRPRVINFITTKTVYNQNCN